eukprot:TRINITY_DN7518_c0_g1_i1.p1 TRINITY_DN7518_c0_g1~~TRINITY_DN7518_c0_g1_i1.p1  ORF type:complete len:149 (-),score=38.90 TRINITY_DN7518_c0_g1_i1:91-537(-)
MFVFRRLSPSIVSQTNSTFYSRTFSPQRCTISEGDAADMQRLISKYVNQDKVVVFMKGVPEKPQCGFSNAVVQIMRMYGVKFASYDVLKDPELREGIKKFSNWPTIPQVFINGEFVGGCDIMIQLHQSSEFEKTLTEAGVEFTPLAQE